MFVMDGKIFSINNEVVSFRPFCVNDTHLQLQIQLNYYNIVTYEIREVGTTITKHAKVTEWNSLALRMQWWLTKMSKFFLSSWQNWSSRKGSMKIRFTFGQPVSLIAWPPAKEIHFGYQSHCFDINAFDCHGLSSIVLLYNCWSKQL